MTEILYRIIDAVHGALILLLMVYVYRLLLVRREGMSRVFHLAGAFFVVTVLQTLTCFVLDEGRLSVPVVEHISLLMDMLVLLSGLGMGWILWRNRQLYDRRLIYAIYGLLVVQWLSYVLCALWQFADWTYFVYLPLCGIAWGTIGWLLDHAEPKQVIPLAVETQTENPFLTELNRVLLTDRFFCDENLTRDEVCRRMLTNRTTFSQHLSEASGMTFSEYLREMRMHEAARLLRETDMPIDQVVFDVGLHSASGFHRNFLLSYGMTPRQYRESAQTVES